MPAYEAVATGERSGLRYAHIKPEWAADLAALELASYPTADPDALYDERSLRVLAVEHPEGCFAGFDGDDIVAMGLGIRLAFDFASPQHTIHDIVPDDGTTSGHDPDGAWYYGTGISTRMEYRRRGIGTELYELRKGVCRTHNLAGIVAGGVIPGYADHKHEMSADAYIAAVRRGELYDRTLTFQLENGFQAPCALANYIEDPDVDDYASLIVWPNPDYHGPNAFVPADHVHEGPTS
ncbi:MAG: GNAT family N-acetyltransferase [Actinomycetota bacterium]